RARPTVQRIEGRGMMIRALYPVKNSRGQVVAVLDGGVLLNANFKFVDTIRDLVYGPGSLPKGSIGTVTVFLNDVRITTNVPRTPNQRALGTRVSDEVRTQVLDDGEKWIDRAFVVNDWYISAY
ncbi:MAG: cache domain-containing protein, partial [Candidatus Thiodiazotropha sp.]